MSRAPVHEWLRGPMVAVATPFNEDLSLDLGALRDNVRFMIERGVTRGQGRLLVGGAGGEHPTLNLDERKEVMTAAVDAAGGDVPVLTSIQHTDTRVVEELARHAEGAGLSGAQLGPTYYYEPTESDVERLFDLVARASDLTLMIYHTWWEGLHFSPELLDRLASIDSVGGLKWDSPDKATYSETIQRLGDRLAVIDNSGQQIWSHMLGATGFITHVSGFWPEYPLEIWQLMERGDYEAARDRLAEFKWPWSKWRSKVAGTTGGEGPFIKAAMEAVGLKTGPPRPPSVRPSAELLQELDALFEATSVPRAGSPARV